MTAPCLRPLRTGYLLTSVNIQMIGLDAYHLCDDLAAQGTVIRVFSIPDGRKLHTFRRGES